MIKILCYFRDQIKAFHAFIDTLSPPWKTTYYAIESAALLSTATMVGNYYFCLTNGTHFNWPSQLHEFQIAVQLGVVKAIWDLFKQLGQPATTSQKDTP